jgi:hypothetical protein
MFFVPKLCLPEVIAHATRLRMICAPKLPCVLVGTTVERSVADLRMIMKEQQNEVPDVEGGCVWALIRKALHTEKTHEDQKRNYDVPLCGLCPFCRARFSKIKLEQLWVSHIRQ